MTAAANPRQGLTMASLSIWPKSDLHELSGPSSGSWPNGQVSAWGRRCRPESHWDGG